MSPVIILLASACLVLLAGWISAARKQDHAEAENKKLRHQLAIEFEVVKAQRDEYFARLESHVLKHGPLRPRARSSPERGDPSPPEVT